MDLANVIESNALSYLLAPIEVGRRLDFLPYDVVVENVALMHVQRHQSFKLEPLQVLEVAERLVNEFGEDVQERVISCLHRVLVVTARARDCGGSGGGLR